jgi:hypothetical protein
MYRMVLLLRTIVLLAFATPALAALEQGTIDEDRLIGTSGADTLRGLGGEDYIVGRASADELSGNDGRDRAYGEDGNDTIGGGAGADRLFGGPDEDVLLGASGNDTIHTGEDDVTDEVRCGSGIETVFAGRRDKQAGAIDAESCEIVLAEQSKREERRARPKARIRPAVPGKDALRPG